jgi:hypothetical protein
MRDEASIGEPRWISDHRFIADLKIYFHAFAAFTLQPRLSAEEWATRRRRFLNPLDFLLKSVAVVSAWHALLWVKFGLPEPTLLASIVEAADPYVWAFAVGSFAHVGFRVLGSKRRLTSTWAVSIYAIGAVPSVVSLVYEVFSIRAKARSMAPFASPVLVCLLVVVPIVTSAFMSAALAGLHGTSRRRSLAVVLVGFLATAAGVVFISLGRVLLRRFVP